MVRTNRSGLAPCSVSIPGYFVFPAIVGSVTLTAAAYVRRSGKENRPWVVWQQNWNGRRLSLPGWTVCRLIYVLAAFKGESWVPLEQQKESSAGTILEAPSKPPPRLPPSKAPPVRGGGLGIRRMALLAPGTSCQWSRWCRNHPHRSRPKNSAPSPSPSPTTSGPHPPDQHRCARPSSPTQTYRLFLVLPFPPCITSTSGCSWPAAPASPRPEQHFSGPFAARAQTGTPPCLPTGASAQAQASRTKAGQVQGWCAGGQAFHRGGTSAQPGPGGTWSTGMVLGSRTGPDQRPDLLHQHAQRRHPMGKAPALG